MIAFVNRNRTIPKTEHVVLAILLITMGWALLRPHLLYVSTPSVPIGFYFAWHADAADLRHGDLAVTCLPAAAVDLARSNHVAVPTGRCPGNAAVAVKFVAAVPGDVVAIDRQGIHVNGATALPASAPLERAPDGAQLPHPRPFIVPMGQAVLWGPHPLSDDSRYWGALVPMMKAIPLLVKT